MIRSATALAETRQTKLTARIDFQDLTEDRLSQFGKAAAFARRREQALGGSQRQVLAQIADVARDAVAENHDEAVLAREPAKRKSF